MRATRADHQDVHVTLDTWCFRRADRSETMPNACPCQRAPWIAEWRPQAPPPCTRLHRRGTAQQIVVKNARFDAAHARPCGSDRLQGMINALDRPDPARNGRIRPVAARSPPLASWAACSKWSARSRIFPWTSTTWSMRVMKFRPKFLLLHRALLGARYPDLPVSPAEAVGVARFCSPNLVCFLV